jgi:hypothetical protein
MISSQRNIMAIETAAVAVHGPAAFVSENLGDSWYDAAMSAVVTQGALDPTARYGYYLSMKSTVETFVPTVRVVCSPSNILRRGNNEVTFPRVPDYGPAVELENKSDWGNSRIRESRTIAVQDEGLQNRTYSKFPKVSMASLFDLYWTNATTGIVIESPWISIDEQRVSGCVLDMRWVQGEVFNVFRSAR